MEAEDYFRLEARKTREPLSPDSDPERIVRETWVAHGLHNLILRHQPYLEINALPPYDGVGSVMDMDGIWLLPWVIFNVEVDDFGYVTAVTGWLNDQTEEFKVL